jgi:hypothetical protein
VLFGILERSQGELNALSISVKKSTHVREVGMGDCPLRLLLVRILGRIILLLLRARDPISKEKQPNQPRIFCAFSGREFSHHLRRLHCQHKLKESVSHNELGKQNRDHHPFTTSHQVFDCAAMRKPGENIGTGVEQTL